MTRLVPRGKGGSSGGRRWALSLDPVEARVVTDLPRHVERVLADPDSNRAVIDRLFPPSYADRAEEDENRRLLGASLYDERRELLAAIRARLARGRRKRGGLELELTVADMDLWLRFVNDVRLLLATELGIEGNIDHGSIDWSHPEAHKYALLEYLGALEYLMVEALASDASP